MTTIRTICANFLHCTLLAALAMGSVVAGSAGAASAPWSNAWITQQPLAPSLSAFSPDGDVLMASTYFYTTDQQVLRMRGDGSVRWTANVHNQIGAYLYALYGNADGSAYLIGEDHHLGRIAPDGSLGWQTDFAVTDAVAVSPQRVLSVDCRLALLDTATGDVLWSYPVMIGTSCSSVSASVDPQGNIYSVAPGATVGVSGYTVTKLDPNGSMLWRQSYADANADTIQFAGGNLYVSTSTGLVALRPGDGSTQWSFAAASSPRRVLFLGADAQPVVPVAGGFAILSPASGQTLWTQVFNNNRQDGRIAVVGDELVTIDDLDTGLIITQRDAAGNVLGNVSLPTGLVPVGVPGTFGAGTGAFVARSSPDSPFAVLAKFALGNASTIATFALPTVTKGIVYFEQSCTETRCVDASYEVDGLHLRSIQLSGGTTDWDLLEHGDWDGRASGSGVVLTQNTVLVSMLATDNSRVFLAAFESASGALRWQKTIYTQNLVNGEHLTRPSPYADGNGDFILTANGIGGDQYGGESILKVAAVDGNVVWQRDTYTQRPPFNLQPELLVQGDQIFAFGPFDYAAPASTFVRLSDDTGATVWKSTLAAPASPGFSHDGHLLVFSSSGFSKVDPLTGAVLWTDASVDSCVGNCEFNVFLELPNGDFINVGDYSDPTRDYATTPWLERRRGDGSGLAFEGNPGLPVDGLDKGIAHAVVGSDGKVWLSVSSYSDGLYTPLATWLSEFDPATNRVTGNQTLSIKSIDALGPSRLFNTISSPEPQRMRVFDTEYLPNQTASTRDALIDTSVSAHGDLSLSVATPVKPTAGGIAHVVINVQYNGDVALQGVQLMAMLSQPALHQSATCKVQGASNCSLDTASGTLRAVFDISPNKQVTIGLDLQSSAADGETLLGATVYGPVGLTETDIGNNSASAVAVRSLFASGFE